MTRPPCRGIELFGRAAIGPAAAALETDLLQTRRRRRSTLLMGGSLTRLLRPRPRREEIYQLNRLLYPHLTSRQAAGGYTGVRSGGARRSVFTQTAKCHRRKADSWFLNMGGGLRAVFNRHNVVGGGGILLQGPPSRGRQRCPWCRPNDKQPFSVAHKDMQTELQMQQRWVGGDLSSEGGVCVCVCVGGGGNVGVCSLG